MWRPGTAVTIASTNVKQLLIPTPNGINLVKSLKIFHDPSNTHIIYWGDTTLNPAATPKTGVLGWLAAPSATTSPVGDGTENDSIDGIDCSSVFVAGTSGEIILWSYIEQ